MWPKASSLPENRPEFLALVDTRNAVCSVTVAAYLSACRTDTVLSLVGNLVICKSSACLDDV
jgi:hypothetical protein